MDRNSAVAALTAEKEEQMLLIRVLDKLERGIEREIPVATAFLSMREQALLSHLLPRCRFFGGTENTERKVAYYLPEYLTEADFFDEAGPISCLRCHFYDAGSVSHRDLLGALMGSGIRRDAVGDLCIREKEADLFVLRELEDYLLHNLTEAGRQHLRLEKIALSEAVKPPQAMKELRATVSTLRFDSVLAAGFHLSRAAASEAIHGGLAAIDSLSCLKPDRMVQEGNVLSLRGKGKMKLLSVDGITRKGRQGITLGIYI